MSVGCSRIRNRRAPAIVAVLGVLAALLAAGSTSSNAAGDDATAARPQLEKVAPEVLDDVDSLRERDPGGQRVEAVVVLGSHPSTAALERTPDDQVASTLQQTARSSQESVVAAIRNHGDPVLNTFWLKNMVLARLTPHTLRALTALDAVERIIPNFRLETPPAPKVDTQSTPDGAATWGIEKIGADVVQDEYGATGEGVRVAVLDTGVDIDHPDLDGRLVTDDPSNPAYPGGWMEFSRTGEPVLSTPHDSERHGTHVAGTVVGGDASGTQIGVAPGADLMAGLVLPGGNGSFAQVIAGMQWAVQPFDAAGNPAGEPAEVVNMSLDVVGQFTALVEPTRNMYLAGIFPSFAIGNNCGGGSGSPGNVYEATAVGATDKADNVADFSCGETVYRSDWTNPPATWPETYVVPDVSAPGVDVLSAFPDGRYGLLDGTSMATPHVSGTVALMLGSQPDLGVDDTLQTLIDTSWFDDRYGSQRPNPRYGWGRIDAYRAFSDVTFDGGVVGTITDAETGDPIAGASITRVDVGRDVESDQEGRYAVKVPAGTYDLEISRFGFQTVLVEGIEVRSGRLTRIDQALTPVPTGKVSGTVVYGPTGSHLPGATVEILGIDAERSATTTVNGAYTIDGLPDGTYRVAASAPGMPHSEASEVIVTAGQTTRQVGLAVPRPKPTRRVSVAADGTDADDESLVPSLSADGRYLAYYSFASNLVTGDSNGRGDVFLLDRRTGTTERVSVGPDGVEGNGTSVRPSISADGRFLAYSSFATNLVAGDTNRTGDVFVHDRETGTTERVSLGPGGVEGNSVSVAPAISADGRYVSYYSFATNLVAGDTNGQGDVFVHDRETGTTVRASVASDGTQSEGGSFVSALSAHGRYVVFESLATNLVADDTNGAGDVFVHDLQTGVTERVSVGPGGVEGNGGSQGGTVSADGRYAAFYSSASNLVAGDTNERDDVFVHDLRTGETRRVSVGADGAQGNCASQAIPKVSLSAHGRYVGFQSNASNLVAGDTNGQFDVFVHDRHSGTTERVSLAPDGSQGDGPSLAPALNADGQVVAFHSSAATLTTGDTNRETDLFVHDRTPPGPEARFALAALRVAPTVVEPGGSVTVTALAKNVGDDTGDSPAVLRVDGEEVHRKTVRLAPNRMTRVRFRTTLVERGSHEIRIGPLTALVTVR